MGLSSVAGGAVNDKTNMTNQAAVTTAFDNSGWNVNIGTGSQTASTTRSDSPIAAGAAGAVSLLKNPLVLALLALVAYKMLRK